MVLRLEKIDRAKEAGFSDDQILESIQNNEKDFSEGISKARDAGFDGGQILDRILEKQRRSTFADVLTQLPAGLTGLVEAPKAVGEFVEFGKDVLTDTAPTLEKFARGFAGIEQRQDEAPAETLGGRFGQILRGERLTPAQFLLGQEGAERARELTGVKAIEDFGSAVSDAIGSIFFSKSAGPFGRLSIEDLPTSDQATDLLSEKLGVDLSPQTALGRATRNTVEGFSKNLFLGPKAAIAMAGGSLVGSLAREGGAPPIIANTLEMMQILKSGRRKPAKVSTVNKAVESLKESDIKQFANKVKKEPTFDVSKAPETSKILETIEAETKGPLLNTLAPSVDIEEGLTRVSQGIDEQFTLARAETSNLYDTVESQVEGLSGIFPSTVSEIDKFLENVDKTGLTGTGKTAVVNAATDLKAALEEGIPLNEAITRKQNINNLFDFEFPDLNQRSKAVSRFSPVRKAYIKELNTNLAAQDRNAFVNFRKAENSHKRNAEIFGKDAVIKLQRGESVLDSRASLKKPQDIDFIKNALGKDSSFTQMVDRLVLDEIGPKNLASMNSNDLNLLKKRLTSNGRNVADELKEFGDTRSIANKSLELQRRVLDDVVNASLTGASPKVSLELMKTKEGLDLVRTALNRSAKGKRALRAVEDLFIQNVFDDLIKKGSVDLDKARALGNNKQMISSIEKINPSAAKLVKNLPKFVEGAEKSLVNMAKSAKATFLANPTKTAMGLVVLKTLGVPLGSLSKVVVGAKIGKAVLSKVLRNVEVSRLLRVIEVNPKRAPAAIIRLNQIVNEQIQKDEK